MAVTAIVASPADAAASGPTRLAARLARLDPGGRTGANTVIGTARNQGLFGVPRPDIIVALGAGETISGGAGGDQLGALADHVTIRGGGGRDTVYGGRRGTLVGGTSDLLVDTKDDATFEITGSNTRVVAGGRHGRVLCAPGARNAVIYADRDDSIASSCRRNHARVLHLASARSSGPSARPRPTAVASAVSGDGSNGSPFVAPCDPGPGCTVGSFARRYLDGFWANEYVPAYRCPSSDPYLLNKKYTPAFSVIGNGIEIQQGHFIEWPIGINIDGQSSVDSRFSGTLTGYPNSSATSWDTRRNYYQVILHCTADRNRGYNLTGGRR